MDRIDSPKIRYCHIIITPILLLGTSPDAEGLKINHHITVNHPNKFKQHMYWYLDVYGGLCTIRDIPYSRVDTSNVLQLEHSIAKNVVRYKPEQ